MLISASEARQRLNTKLEEEIKIKSQNQINDLYIQISNAVEAKRNYVHYYNLTDSVCDTLKDKNFKVSKTKDNKSEEVFLIEW